MGYEKLAIEQYGQAAVNASANMAELTRAATRVTVSTREVTEAGREHASVTNRQTVATQGHAAAMRDAHSGARGLASAFGAMWLTWGNIAPLLAGAAIGHSLVQAVKKGMEFEYTLTFIKALGEETAESVHKLGAAVLKLGSEGLYGPLELVKGLQVLEQAGVRAAEGMLVLPHVLDLATVGEMKMAEAAKTLVGVMNAFNLGILKSSFVGDVFAKAAAESQTSVEQMTQAMRTASVVGEMYGASMEDTATALTILAKLNITGTAAGTSFRNMLKELYAPTDAAAKVMKQLGMQAHDANGNLLPFSTVVYSLRETLKGYDRISQTNILQKLFGERGSKEAIAMLSLSRAEWDELQGKITGASGFMMGVAAELEASTKGVFKQAINNLEASMIKAFENTDNAAKNLAVGLRSAFGSQEMVAVLTSLVSGTLAFLDVVMKLGPALLVVGQGIAVFLGIRLLHIAVVAAAGALGTLLTAVKAVGVALAESLFVWATGGGLALGALVTPLALVTAGIVALGAAWWVFHTDTSSQVITDINNLSDALDRQLGKLRSINDELIKKIDLEMRGTTPGQYEVSRAQREIDTLQAAVNAARLVEPVEGVGHFGKGALKKKEAYDKAQRIITEGEAKLIESRKKLRQLEFEEERRAALQDGASLAEQINKNKKGGTDPLTAGTKKFSAADRDADNQLKKEVQAITDQFKLEEQLAKAQYATDVALEKAKLDAKLITQTQFANQRFAIEKEYLSKVVQAEQSAGRAIEALEGKADKKSVAMGFQNTRNENWNKIIVQQMKDMEDERKQLELAEIKARGEIQKFQSETLPKMQTKDKVEIEAQVSKRGGMLMSEADKAAAEASIAKTKEYSQVIGEQEAKLDEMARTNSTWTASMTGQVAVIDSLKTAMKSAAETAGQTARQTVEFNRSLAVGAAQAFSEYENSATNAAANIKGVFERAFKGLEDALVNFVKTGKMDFRSLADSIISDLIRIQVRQSITGPLAGMMKGMFNPIAAVAGAAAVSEGTNWVADFNNAQGGVYSSADLHGYANTIVSSPTLFRFAKGGAFRGLMGEAGPEAIMPLARGSDGMLGVRSQGGGAPNIEFNVINQTGSSAKARQSGPAQFDGSKWVIGIVLEAAETDPSFRSALGIGR
jgi:TP901 family phage tail tape measure protein/lambda family phage tail tape measure protein